MQWKSWAKETAGILFKLGQPKELPSQVGRYLVVNLRHDPDWVWSLKMVITEKELRKELVNFRIYDPINARTQGLGVKDYHSLDTHPQAIIFAGWYNRKTWEMEITSSTVCDCAPTTH